MLLSKNVKIGIAVILYLILTVVDLGANVGLGIIPLVGGWLETLTEAVIELFSIVLVLFGAWTYKNG